MTDQFQPSAVAISVRGDAETINRMLKEILNMGWWLLSIKPNPKDPLSRLVTVIPKNELDSVAVDIKRRKLQAAYGVKS